MAKDAELLPLRPRRDCPICGRRATRAAYPFCSRRCADIDLNRWLSGGYAIPGRDGEAEEGGGRPEDGGRPANDETDE